MILFYKMAYLVRICGHADAEGEPAEGGVRNLQGDRQGVAHRYKVPAGTVGIPT